MKRYVILLVMGLVISFTYVQAKTNEKAGMCAAQFLKIGAGARPSGMGEAFCAVSNDINAVYWNPAGLYQINQKQATFMHNEWLYDIKYEFLAYCQPTDRGVSAVSLIYLRMGDLEGKDMNDNPIGDFSAYDCALNIAYSLAANKNTYLGITGKLIQQKIENEKAKALAIDIGILHLESAKEGFKTAAVVQNLGSKLKFVQQPENLPLTYKMGISYKRNKLLLATDITKPEDNNTRINIGVEYLFNPTLTLRAGYNSQNDLDSGWTVGAGVNLKSSQFDYAFVPYGELDDTHRFSVIIKF
ncbi:MAG: PorV/PorQ family protein [bacterium]